MWSKVIRTWEGLTGVVCSYWNEYLQEEEGVSLIAAILEGAAKMVVIVSPSSRVIKEKMRFKIRHIVSALLVIWVLVTLYFLVPSLFGPSKEKVVSRCTM